MYSAETMPNCISNDTLPLHVLLDFTEQTIFLLSLQLLPDKT
jgi:hypothetical protein